MLSISTVSHCQLYVLYIDLLAELHADLFSHHANLLEVYVFAAVDERGEGVMPNKSCRRCNRKRQRRRRGG